MEPQMDADARGYRAQAEASINGLTEAIIGCAFAVANTLGPGFLEKVYENALAHELRKQGIACEQQRPVEVRYDQVVVGAYVIDLLVDGRVILEIKATKQIEQNQITQTINYLKATGHQVGLILNFAKPRLEVKRLVHNL